MCKRTSAGKYKEFSYKENKNTVKIKKLWKSGGFLCKTTPSLYLIDRNISITAVSTVYTVRTSEWKVKRQQTKYFYRFYRIFNKLGNYL